MQAIALSYHLVAACCLRATVPLPEDHDTPYYCTPLSPESTVPQLLRPFSRQENKQISLKLADWKSFTFPPVAGYPYLSLKTTQPIYGEIEGKVHISPAYRVMDERAPSIQAQVLAGTFFNHPKTLNQMCQMDEPTHTNLSSTQDKDYIFYLFSIHT